jgi:hypothetical protein
MHEYFKNILINHKYQKHAAVYRSPQPVSLMLAFIGMIVITCVIYAVVLPLNNHIGSVKYGINS